jgi:hypothetical protein
MSDEQSRDEGLTDDEIIKDLEPESEDAEAVTGGQRSGGGEDLPTED